jgi:hypothetical protein
MHCIRTLGALLSLALVGPGVGAAVVERERNFWPVLVERTERDGSTWAQGAGPLLFSRQTAEGRQSGGLRPFWLTLRGKDTPTASHHLLYPIFTWRTDEIGREWSLMELVRRREHAPASPSAGGQLNRRDEFEVFPIWFQRRSGNPERDHRALFPVYGTLRGRLGFERVSWTLFPLYVENERRGAVTRSVAWPVFHRTTGSAQGWGIWPFFSWKEIPGVMRQESYLWPLGFNHTRQPDADAPPGTEPRRDVGMLPFFVRNTGPGYRNEDVLWPLFGHTERTGAKAYEETRYLWPLFVQGQGTDKTVNRWAPLYTHSINRGYEKTWYLWPLLRNATWSEAGVTRDRTQLLYFLFWSETQRRSGSSAAPAQLTHLWPLLSEWEDGNGRSQWQMPSPLEVFFPGNEKVRQAWSPLFALVRHEQTAPGEARTSLLWDAITWETRDRGATREFHLGPLAGYVAGEGERRLRLLGGLCSITTDHAGQRRVLWLDFGRQTRKVEGQP